MHPRFRVVLAVLGLCTGAWSRADDGAVLVRHAPSLKGIVDGSVQMMSGESTSVEGSAKISGSLLVPGTPAITLKSGITYGGTIVGTGAVSPTGYTITINTGSTLGHVVSRTSPVDLPVLVAPTLPTGTRTVTIKKATDSVGSYTTLKNLTLEKGVGSFAIPSGSYGAFTAKTSTGFALGTPGAQTPEIYDFQSLNLESGSAVTLLGPVVINLASGTSLNGSIGESTHPAWLTLNLYSGSLTLNSGNSIHGTLNATNSGSLVTIKTDAQVVGGLACDKLSIESGGLVRLVAPTPNQPPSVSLTNPVDGAAFPAEASIVLQASATDTDGTVAGVAFYNETTLLGESGAAPYQYTWQNVPAGNYVLTARATDNAGAATASAAVNISVVAPPVITSGPTASAQVGAPFSYQITATNNPASFSASGLPDGLSISSTTGLISGTPTTAGTNSVAVGATNLGGTGTAVLALVVNARDGITSPSSAEGQVGKAFAFQVEANNSPTGFGAVGLPSGLTIDPVTGLISGTPTQPGVRQVVVTATGTGEPVSSTLTLTVLATLPYVTDFETSEGYADGALDSQFGWVVSQGGASVDAADSFTGLRSASLPPGAPPAVVTQTFAPDSAARVVFADFFAKPVAREHAENSTLFTAGPARFALELADTQGVLYSYNNDTGGAPVWRPTAFSVPLDADSRAVAWIRFTARMDFSRSIWDLYANGRMVAAGLTFPGDRAPGPFSLFQVQGDTGAESRIDDVYVGETHPLFADVNSNGIDDAWETEHGLSLATYNRDDSPSGNGITVIQAYVNETDPNDFYASVPPSLTIIEGEGQVSPPGEFNPLPFTVEVRDHAGAGVLSNAPVTFTVVAGGGQLNLGGPGDNTTSTTMLVRTGADGRAQLYFKQPPAPSIQSAIKVTAGLSELTFHSTSSGPTEPSLLVAGGDATLWQEANGPPRLWGANTAGQLGDGTLTSRSQMKRLAGLTGSLRHAALGAEHGVACDSAGQLFTWGDNYFGQLGDGTTTSRKVAAPVVGLANVTDVAAGDHHSLALASDGSVYAWGDNRNGQLGSGTVESQITPHPIDGLTQVIAICARGNVSAAIKADGTVWIWGANDFGQLAATAPSFSAVPVQIGNVTGATKIVAGRNFFLVVTAAGAVTSWGASYTGQLGRSATFGSLVANTVPGLANIVQVAAGDRHGVALDTNGTVWVWGANEVGQLADPSLVSHAVPVALALPPIQAIAAGSDHVIALKADGSLLAWGANDQSQLGSVLTDSFSAAAVAVLPPND